MENNELSLPRVEAVFQQKEAQKARKRKFRIFRFLLISLFLGPLIFVTAFILSVVNDLPPLDVIENPQTDLSTQVYSSDGKLIRSFYI